MGSNIITLDISGVDFNKPKFKMVGGLNIDTLKIKYNWIFNAQMENAIIGEDENGLVWFSGTWICGTWEGGTWYSGEFLSGRWKAGDMYSYHIDQRESLLGKLSIIRKDITKTRFKSGTWEGGNFHYGIFGKIKNESDLNIPYEVSKEWIISNVEDYEISGTSFVYQRVTETIVTGITGYCTSGSSSYETTGVTCPIGYTYSTGITQTIVTGLTWTILDTAIFKKGNFYTGWINSAYFENGNFYNDVANNIIWYNGIWYNGCFLIGNWYGGSFFGGGFSNGNWYGGTLSTNKDTSSTRFGCNYKGSGCNWYGGTFSNGQFHSGINEIDGITKPSLNHSVTNWYGGTFTNGEWYGGSFHSGLWETGRFYSGIIYNIIWKRGHITDCIWKNGQFIEGTISGGIFDNMVVTNSNFGYDI
jgi:hypothetical protein